MGSGFAKQKKQARALQEQFSKMQEQAKATEVTGLAGNGLVAITLNGEHEMLKISIKKECVDPDDLEGLEDLIKEAYKSAFKQLQSAASSSMPQLPGLPDLSAFGL
ncbi:MAG: YbaB/EbfC family nucleoid-associated protein [Chlamydiales bacterium]|nr:YbaB/EbfC family nucleoid-associated protein [Chlamydiales bacterium]